MLNAEEISAVLEQVLSIAINCVSNTASTGIDPDGGNAVIRIKVSDWLHIFLLSEEFLADLSFAGYYLIETGCVSDHPVKKQPIVRVLRRPCEADTVHIHKFQKLSCLGHSLLSMQTMLCTSSLTPI